MITDNYTTTDMTAVCANCGIAEIDDIKLVPCDDCDLVKYCSNECREDHKSEHEEECKNRVAELRDQSLYLGDCPICCSPLRYDLLKSTLMIDCEHVEECMERAAELRDELLFKQPEGTHMGDCPICTIPHSLHLSQSTIMTCCSKIICDGCYHANWMREEEMRLEHSCPFCRQPIQAKEENEKYLMKRLEANDPVAMCQKGIELYIKKGEYSRAFNFLRKAAELGDVEAHARLATMYDDGNGVEKDKEKRIHHLQIATIGGHPDARTMLGLAEFDDLLNVERAVKHWIIAATQGHDGAITALMEMYKKFEGKVVSKEDLAAALRAHKAAVDATKSPEREAALQYSRILKLKGMQDSLDDGL